MTCLYVLFLEEISQMKRKEEKNINSFKIKIRISTDGENVFH